MTSQDPIRSVGSGGTPRWKRDCSLLGTLLLLLALFAPPLLRGEVLYSHDNATEVGLSTEGYPPGIRPLGDQSELYIAEMHAHLQCQHRSWIATWNPHNELGRPLFPVGIGKAYVVGHLVSLLTDDAFRFYTWMALIAVCGTALFAHLFFRQIGLHPLACFAGAVGISAGPLHMTWQGIPMIQWGFCWAFAALLASERWSSKPSVWNWLGAAFATHAILLTGFPQHVVLLGWIVAGWVCVQTCAHQVGWRGRLKSLIGIGAAAIAGAVSVAPVYADLFLEWQRSLRADFPAGSSGMTPKDWGQFWLSLYDTFWLHREPGASPRSLVTLTSVYAGMVVMSVAAWRSTRAWYWIACAVLTLAATLHSGLAEALRYVGLVLSAFRPIYGGYLAWAVLSAIGVDRALRCSPRARVVNAALTLTLLVAALGFALASGIELDPLGTSIGATLGLIVCLFALRPRAWLLAPAVVGVVFLHTREIQIWRPRADIQTSSPLAAELQSRTADGSRVAWVGPTPHPTRFLASNHEISLNFTSIHTYDHLVSLDFDRWIRDIRGENTGEKIYQRRFRNLWGAGALTPEFFAASGVSTLLTTRPLRTGIGMEIARHGEVRVYAARRPGPLQALVPAESFAQDTDRDTQVELSSLGLQGEVTRLPSPHHDVLRFELEPSPDTQLLFVSQAYHPNWKARASAGPLETTRINELNQGVLVPPGTTEVELSFEPWIRWSILPQVGFLLGLVAFLVAGIRKALTGGHPSGVVRP